MNATAELIQDVYTRADNPLIRATLAPLVANPDGFAQGFYDRLFARAPALRGLFPYDMAQQRMKLVHTLGVVATGLDETNQLVQALRELGARHRRYGVKFAHYLEVGEALVDTLAEMNGPAFTPEARAAWQRLYAWVAEQMRRG